MNVKFMNIRCIVLSDGIIKPDVTAGTIGTEKCASSNGPDSV